MSADWVIALMAVGTLVIQLALGAYVHGKLSERVSGHGRRLDKVETRLDDHDTRLREVERGL